MSPRRSRRALAAGLAAVCLFLAAAAASLFLIPDKKPEAEREAEPPPPRTGGLPAFAPEMEATVPGAVAIALDGEDRLWVLTREPDAFVRLDETGSVVETIPFAWPEGTDGALAGDPKLVLTGSGDFLVGRTRFDRTGRRTATLDYHQGWDLAAGPDDTAVLLTGSGLEVFDRGGRRVRAFSDGGIAPGKIADPKALVVDERGRSLVADRFRLQVFSRRGRFLRAVELPAELQGDIARIDDLARDGSGTLYVRLVNHPVEVAVFDRELRYLGPLRFLEPWHTGNLAADRRGRLYSFANQTVRRAGPVAGSVADARPLPEATARPASGALPVRAAQAVEVRARLLDSPPRPFRLHLSPRDVQDLAADPRVPGRLWLATTGGLVLYEPATESWRLWTVADGLPEPDVRSVLSDGRRVFLLLRYGAAVFDIETERFQALDLRTEDDTRLGGGRLLADPGRPDRIWWMVGHGVLRHDPKAGTWTFFRAPGPVVDSLLLPGPDLRLVLLTQEEVWELRPDAGLWRRLADVDGLDRATPDRPRPSDKLMPRTLSASPDGRGLWIGDWSADLLVHLDLESGELSWPAWARDLRCGPARVVSFEGRRFLAGSDCFREIGEGCCCEVAPEEAGEVRRALADPRLPGLLWLATDQGLASFRLKDGSFGRHRPAGPEPPGVWADSLLPLDGRLWVAFNNAPLGVLDPATGAWTSFPDLRSIRLLRRAPNGLLLAYGTFRQGMDELFWIDPRRIEQGSRHAGWRSVWTHLDDLHLDAQGLWGTGYLEGKDAKGFALLRPDGTRHVWLEGSRAPHRFVADPRHPGWFWLRTPAGDLSRFHPETGESELVQPAVHTLHFTGDRWLWAVGRTNLLYDLETGARTELRLTGNILPDPDDPGRAWSQESERLQLCDLGTGELLLELPLRRGNLHKSPVLFGDRLWLATDFGLLEAPLEPLRPPAGQAPAKCRAWR